MTYVPDFSTDNKNTLESEYSVTIADKSQSMQYIVVKKKLNRTISRSDLNSLFRHDLRDCINRYAESRAIQLYCYHENIMLSSELYDVEILCHTVDCCDPEKIIEKIQFGQSVPQGTDENQSGICNQCGKLIDKDQDYCLNCFDLLDHNTIAADLREQKRLLEVAAHKLVSHVSIEQALECVAKSLELNLQLCADLVDEMGGCAVQPEGGDVATNLPLPSDFSEIPNLICAWCKKVLRETSSTQISHGCCDDCAERLLDEDTATSEAI